MLGEAWNELAVAHARLGNHAREIAAYDQALRFEPHPEERGVLLANRAEGLMALGEIRAAVASYRAALAATPGYALGFYGVTTWWGLAVALDRSGDLSGAMTQIALARAYDPEDRRLSSDSWFYLPDYDRHWYAALGRWYDARHTADDAGRFVAYEQAAAAWRSYLDHAPTTDRWRALAAARLRQCELERRKRLEAPR
jgi:tetratricopeptide (TPR) repeat protein